MDNPRESRPPADTRIAGEGAGSPGERPGVVLALGGGGARGLAHIGVIQVLVENAIPVRAIVGTSVGAEIGAFYANGADSNDLESLATAFDWKETLLLFFPDLPTGGLVSGRNILSFLQRRLGQRQIESLAIGYAAMATDLETGESVTLDRGPLVDAVRASISIPGLIAPYRYGSRWLVDGGVLNPLPFDVARDLFGGPVVAVGTHAGMRLRRPEARTGQWPERVRQLLQQPWVAYAEPLRSWLEGQLAAYRNKNGDAQPWPARLVFDQVLDIIQAEVVRLHARTHPPDLFLMPAVGHIGPLEFYRAREAIAAGREAAQAHLDELKSLLRQQGHA